MSTYKIPRLLRFIFAVALLNVLVFSVFRVAFWAYFNSPTDPIDPGTLANAFFIGFKFDVRVVLVMALPVLLLAWIPYLNPFAKVDQSGATRSMHSWIVYMVVVFALMLIVYITHFAYYAYLQVPLDATILRFFANPGTSALMVWQSYPVVWLVMAWMLALAIYTLALYKLVLYFKQQPLDTVRRRYKVAIVSTASFFIIFGLYGKMSWYPLRWSDAYFSTHPFAAVVAINPAIHAASTLKNKEIQFDKDAVSQSYELMAEYLGVDEPNKDALSFKRVGHANGYHVSQPNVVLVLLESFATYKTGLSGNALDPTPYFDGLAKDGVYFDNFFVPHTGTARSVFTTLTGLADVETKKTSSRNPLIVNQHTIINSFENYEKLYFIGGSASWGNIRGILSHNIPGLKLYEEGSYDSPRMDVWGISDLHLLEESNKILRTQQEPFFAVIQTSGNHRPYNIPEDNRGFEVRDVDKKEVFKHGFHSVSEYNSFRFMDHSIRLFMEAAQQESYFDNTIFVFYGDHGIHANTGIHTPPFEEQLKIQGLRVPFVIYAPKLLPKGKVINKVASEVDVLPTIAGLAANDYVNTTMGRDLFDERYDKARYAFTVTHGQGLRIGLLDDRYYFLMNEDGSNKILHDMHSEKPRDNVMSQFADKATELEQLTRAIFETTRYMRYHNSRI
ncbi:MAG: sulfatase-like hydrolase/transferase [Gammaproteobacteria bacterium]|jgi:phosphoglycerol transferase MdoB-like AlkP superfamily enzyme